MSFALCLGALFFRAYVLFKSSYYGAGAESIGLYGILDVAEGQNLYRSSNERPYLAFIYTPLYPFVMGTMLKVLPLTELADKVLAIKLVGILFAILLFALFWLAVPDKNFRNAIVVTLAFVLGSSRLFDYIGTTRNDLAALVTEFLSLIAFSKYIKSQKTGYLFWFVACSVVGCWNRQMATLVFVSGLTWLVLNHRIKHALFSFGLWGGCNVVVLATLFHRYGPSLLDHIFYSNIRLWKTFDSSLLTTSLLSYLSSVGLFLFLLLQYFRHSASPKGSVKQFYTICFFVSGAIGVSSYFRAGGDVNYLFLPVLIGSYFILPELKKGLQSSLALGLITLQLLGIGYIYFQKTKLSLQYSQLPYSLIADQVEKRFPGPGLIVGHYAQNMGIYLKNWAYHGPDLTNGPMLSRSAHPRLAWLWEDAVGAIRDKKVNVLVDAHPGCKFGPSLNSEWFADFPKKEALADWLCVYTR